jgi:hypothetical protein
VCLGAVLVLSACSGRGTSSADAATSMSSMTPAQMALIRQCVTAEAAASGSADTVEVYRSDWDTVARALHIPTSSTGTDPVYLVWLSGRFHDASGAGQDLTHGWMVIPPEATSCPTDDVGYVEAGTPVDLAPLGSPTTLT